MTREMEDQLPEKDTRGTKKKHRTGHTMRRHKGQPKESQFWHSSSPLPHSMGKHKRWEFISALQSAAETELCDANPSFPRSPKGPQRRKAPAVTVPTRLVKAVRRKDGRHVWQTAGKVGLTKPHVVVLRPTAEKWVRQYRVRCTGKIVVSDVELDYRVREQIRVRGRVEKSTGEKYHLSF